MSWHWVPALFSGDRLLSERTSGAIAISCEAYAPSLQSELRGFLRRVLTPRVLPADKVVICGSPRQPFNTPLVSYRRGRCIATRDAPFEKP